MRPTERGTRLLGHRHVSELVNHDILRAVFFGFLAFLASFYHLFLLLFGYSCFTKAHSSDADWRVTTLARAANEGFFFCGITAVFRATTRHLSLMTGPTQTAMAIGVTLTLNRNF